MTAVHSPCTGAPTVPPAADSRGGSGSGCYHSFIVRATIARFAAFLVAFGALAGCGGAPGGWQRLWQDRWEWRHHGTEWVYGVSAAELALEVAAPGASLRAELLGVGPEPATIEVTGPDTAMRLQVAPGERQFLDAALDRGPYSVTVPSSAVLGSPRVGAPLAAPRLLVFVLVDTLRADHVDARLTPGIEAAFGGGRRWREANANCSWTLPSVASLFASRPVLGLSSPEGDLIGLPEGVESWAGRLERAGFEGGAVVANYSVHALNGFAGGFASYLVPDGHGSAEHPDAAWVVAEARRWLAAHQGEDSFLYLHLMDPHQPYRSHADPSLAAPDLEPLAMRRRQATAAESELLQRLYAGEVAHVDRVLSPFLAELPERAVVALTSDHGEALGEHDAWGHGLNLYQEALRVPLLIRGPGVPAGEVADPVQLMDLAPTLLGLVGVDTPEGMEGRSLLDGGSAAPLVSTTFGGGPLRWAWREGRHKVVLRMAAQAGLGATARSAMLEGRPLPSGGFHFDLVADPGESQPTPVPEELLPAAGRAFAATAGRLVPGLQVLIWGRHGPVEALLQVPGSLEVVQAWGVGPMTVERTGDGLVARCADGYPVCAAAARIAPPPEWVEQAGERMPRDRLAPPATDMAPGVHVWWNPDRPLVVRGHDETLQRLRVLGYIE